MKTNAVRRGVGRAAGRGLVAVVLVSTMVSAGAVAMAAERDGAQRQAIPSVPALVAVPTVVAVPTLAPAVASAPIGEPSPDANPGQAVDPASANVPAPAAGPRVAPAQIAAPAAAAVEPPPPAPALTPSDVIRETGAWFSHGHTLELRGDGTGTFAIWHGAFDGTTIDIRLIPAPGAATVAEVLSVGQIGAGALAPDEQPGVGGLVTIAFGDVPATRSSATPEDVRTAHVEWTSGANRQAVDLCPSEGIDAEQMAMLRCGA